MGADVMAKLSETATVTTTTTPTTVSVTASSINTSSPVPTTTVTSKESESTPNTNIVTTLTTPTISSSSGGSTTTVSSLTLSNNGSSTSTVTEGVSSKTIASVTFSSITSSENSTPKPSTTGPSSPCQGDPCSGGSVCVSLNSTYFCLCLDGYYYKSSTCNKGKIFPGTITVKVSETSGLEDEHSVAYQELYHEITTFFGNAFNNTDYGQTVILKVSISPSARSEMRAGDQTVNVAVVNILVETTSADEERVSDIIEEAIRKYSGDITGYTMQDRCDYYGCKKTKDDNDCSNGLLCTCKDGLERPSPQIPFCSASSQCPDGCNEENKKQCLLMDDGSTDCVCLSGYEKDGQGTCQKCAFGYSGVNCKDPFQLTLTIVGVIAAILLLGVVIAWIVSLRSKNRRQNIEEQNLIDNDYQNLRLQQTTGFSNPGADGSIFPRVRTNISRDGQPQNPYANRRGMQNPYANQTAAEKAERDPTQRSRPPQARRKGLPPGRPGLRVPGRSQRGAELAGRELAPPRLAVN
ncbi:PREDICTED: mucin-13 [Ceratotherium simum simum]|uniref:Mucin-13 n=1 Tax=Ceratotherium simum simum TaxID=73337 RepID=A0ABM1CG04_CERSS|nr:PREDICTED: mucin-13 [Ceratotherium simum simum]